jgi:uncharacterized protein
VTHVLPALGIGITTGSDGMHHALGHGTNDGHRAGGDEHGKPREGPAMRLVMSPQAIAVVRLPAGAPDPTWAIGGPLVSITKTDNETSVICPTSAIPEEVPGPVNGPLVGVYVDEQVDFSQAGILVALLKPLADAGIPVLTVSTYDTDWILIEASRTAEASSVWRAAGYQVMDAATHADGPGPGTVIDVRDDVGADVVGDDVGGMIREPVQSTAGSEPGSQEQG